MIEPNLLAVVERLMVMISDETVGMSMLDYTVICEELISDLEQRKNATFIALGRISTNGRHGVQQEP